MAGQEQLGFTHNVVPIAAAKLISLKDSAGVTFYCTGADTFTVKTAATYNGSATTEAIISRYYESTATDGSAGWTSDSGDLATPVSSVTIASGLVAFYIDESDMPAGSAYVEVTVGTAGLVTAVVGALKVGRGPLNLRPLSGANS